MRALARCALDAKSLKTPLTQELVGAFEPRVKMLALLDKAANSTTVVLGAIEGIEATLEHHPFHDAYLKVSH